MAYFMKTNCDILLAFGVLLLVYCTLMSLQHQYKSSIQEEVGISAKSGGQNGVSSIDQRKVGVTPTSYLDPWYCEVDCEFGVPCTYRDEVDFRIIVMTYERAESLTKCLDKIKALDTMGARVSVDIWIDRSLAGAVDKATLQVANAAAKSWDQGRICVHVQRENAYIGGQWRNTWRPQPNTREIGLILEDDVDISPHTYRFLKAVTEKYGHRDDISGYTLQMQDIFFRGTGHERRMNVPARERVFLYGVLGTWGFSPQPKAWREFQDWFQFKDDSLKPLVPGITPTNWYKRFEKQNTSESMWEMWHMYQSNMTGTYCVYCNLVAHSGRKDVLLSVNRKEAGLHFGGKEIPSQDQYLLRKWNDSYIDLPTDIIKYNYDGAPMNE